jgi:beta-glucosidase
VPRVSLQRQLAARPPGGLGAVNQRGLDFYQRLVDALLDVGVQPLINLFHWDLPQALQDRGGFANPEVVGWFTDYTSLVASSLGDRVKDWMTFNEPAVFAFLGHADGIHAPGLRDWPTAIRVADNELRAHAAPPRRSAAWSTARRSASRSTSTRSRRRPIRSAIASPLPSGARRAMPGSSIRSSAGAIPHWDSRRTAKPATSMASSSPTPPAGDLDYLGLNYYRRDSVSARSDRAFDCEIGAVAGSEQTQMDWHVAPDGLRDVLDRAATRPTRRLRSRSPRTAPRIRIPRCRRPGARRGPHLVPGSPHRRGGPRALAAGVPLTGYYVWSLLDNYEWSLGYSRRFRRHPRRLRHQRRTPKDSARWYQRLIARA